MRLVVRGARAVTLAEGPIPRRGAALRELSVVDRADVVTSGGLIESVGPAGSARAEPGDTVIEAGGRVLMPGFVDCHTHLCSAGDRLDEWERRLRGETYLDILTAGGGIMSTVRAVREMDEAALADGLARRLVLALREGTTTVEVKSGYGLSTVDELKMLRAIRAAAARFPGTVVSTALLGHAKDAAVADFVARTIGETLPAVRREFPASPVDAFCEAGAWSLDECARLFDAAMASGARVRVHADQFTPMGMTEWMIERSAASALAVSVDHLEATAPAALRRLAGSRLFGVMLPCTGFHTDDRYGRGRDFIDAGGALAIATNANPGSSPTWSAPLTIALAVRKLGLTPAEAIAACTVNAAALLGAADRGVIAPGKRADLVLLRHTDERMLAHHIGGNPVDAVIVGSAVVSGDGER